MLYFIKNGVFIVMNNKSDFPCAIVSEKDLKLYENYLKKDTNKYPISIENPINSSLCEKATNYSIPSYLHTHIGKLVKVESLLGENIICRIGTLFQVSNNFLVLKLKEACMTVMIELSSVKFITIIHDNDVTKMKRY